MKKLLVYLKILIPCLLDLALNYKELQNKGYNKSYLDQNLNSMLSMPFSFHYDSCSSILTMNTLKRSNNFTFFVVGLITCVLFTTLKIYH